MTREGAMLAMLALCAGCNSASVQIARGDYEVDLPDSNLSDTTSAELLQIRLDQEPEKSGKMGGGMILEFLSTEDDLFDDSGNGAQVDSFEIFPYFLLQPKFGESVELPVRLGMMFSDMSLDGFGIDTTWSAIGFKAALSPELALLSSTETAEKLALFADLSGWYGGAEVETSAGDSAGYGGDAYGYGAEVGLRYRYKVFEIDGSVLTRVTDISNIDLQYGSGQVEGIRGAFTGLALRFTFRF